MISGKAGKPSGGHIVGTEKRVNHYQSYEDIEGLLMNLGVVAALMLAFSVGLFATIGAEEWQRADFFSALIDHHSRIPENEPAFGDSIQAGNA